MGSKRRHDSSDDDNLHAKRLEKETKAEIDVMVSSKNGTQLSTENALSDANHSTDIPASSVKDTPEPPQKSQRTFKLFEFHQPFEGPDEHHFVFIQRESNTEALTTLKRNLRKEMREDGSMRSFSRVFTETDIKSIQTSSLEILSGFRGSNDRVTYSIILGKIAVQPRGSATEAKWYFKTFDGGDWKKGFKLKSGQVLDLETDVLQ
ncbi:unnamed protein product [Clonostachys rosea]|uniref:Uncharacterized protein n=1 Tax=Bionectria ochroleuca TaxID=29856 RepID=A0ABY6V4V5_BIOOC|nr:unnamed protein product [Clonostachys rosea]